MKKFRFRTRFLVMVSVAIVAAGVVGLSLFAFYLDAQVRREFDGRHYALPARVYASPLELFAGARLTPQRFMQELDALGYKQGLMGNEPGRFERRGNDFYVLTRPFVFWDGAAESQALRLSFGAEGLDDVRNARDGVPLSLVRLEPKYIGGIYPAHNEDRVLVKLEEVPADLVHGLLAIEDRKFYSHIGIDPRGMTRAVVSTLSGGGVQGGSTLTQQLVKNFFLTPERTLKRKATEVMMAVLLERHYDKSAILETYVNEIYLGQDKNRAIHGFGLAAQFYFDKRLKDLTLPQAALLVGMVKGPSYYDPRRHPERALARRNIALAAMRDEQYITNDQYLKAKSAPLGVVAKPSTGTTAYPAFLDLVRRQLQAYYQESDLRTEGLQIFTTLDPHTQSVAEQVLSTRLAQLDQRTSKLKKAKLQDTGRLEGAVVVADVQSGEVQAFVGGRDPRFPGFNRALDSRRPIGSLMKPAVYLTALSKPEKYTLISLLDDEPLTWNEHGRAPWTPQNYDRVSHGQVALRSALAHSYNVATARLGQELGLGDVLETVRRLGIEREIPPYASSLLGAVNLSPMDVAQMYQTFGSAGFRAPLRAIREVLTVDGTPLQRYGLSVNQVVEPASAYLLTAALQGVAQEGTGKWLRDYLPGINVAGKTGTTDDLRDSWFAGYTGDRVAVVWVGYDDNRSTSFTGASGAMPIWGEIIAKLDPQPVSPPLPDNVELVWIEAASGLRADKSCPGAVEIPFVTGSAPEDYSDCVSSGTRIKSWFQRLFD